MGETDDRLLSISMDLPSGDGQYVWVGNRFNEQKDGLELVEAEIERMSTSFRSKLPGNDLATIELVPLGRIFTSLAIAGSAMAAIWNGIGAKSNLDYLILNNRRRSAA